MPVKPLESRPTLWTDPNAKKVRGFEPAQPATAACLSPAERLGPGLRLTGQLGPVRSLARDACHAFISARGGKSMHDPDDANARVDLPPACTEHDVLGQRREHRVAQLVSSGARAAAAASPRTSSWAGQVSLSPCAGAHATLRRAGQGRQQAHPQAPRTLALAGSVGQTARSARSLLTGSD